MAELPIHSTAVDDCAPRLTARIDTGCRADYLGGLQDWNARLIDQLRCIRILEAVRWRGEIERDFFAHDGRELPRVSLDDYRRQAPRLNVPWRLLELRRIEREISSRLGTDQPAARLLLRRCRGAQKALRLIAARGTTEFVWLSRDIYGSSLSSRTTRERLLRLVAFFESAPPTEHQEERYTAASAARQLAGRLHDCFNDSTIRVELATSLHADACAGPGYLKLRGNATFTAGDIDLLEAHEGWAHLGTMLSGRRQPIFSLLAACPPCVTVTQEGLAVLTELIAGVCHAKRRWRLASRLRAVMMAEDGADFLQVYRFLCDRFGHERDAYHHACRVFRGSLPSGVGPFTKDLSYGIGLLELVGRLRTMADDANQTVPLLFAGKTCLDDLPDLDALHGEGLLVCGEFIPPPFREPALLRSALRELGAC